MSARLVFLLPRTVEPALASLPVTVKIDQRVREVRRDHGVRQARRTFRAGVVVVVEPDILEGEGAA